MLSFEVVCVPYCPVIALSISALLVQFVIVKMKIIYLPINMSFIIIYIYSYIYMIKNAWNDHILNFRVSFSACS